MRHYTSRVLERSRAESLTTVLLTCLRAQHPVLPLYLLPTTLPQLVVFIPSALSCRLVLHHHPSHQHPHHRSDTQDDFTKPSSHPG